MRCLPLTDSHLDNCSTSIASGTKDAILPWSRRNSLNPRHEEVFEQFSRRLAATDDLADRSPFRRRSSTVSECGAVTPRSVSHSGGSKMSELAFSGLNLSGQSYKSCRPENGINVRGLTKSPSKSMEGWNQQGPSPDLRNCQLQQATIAADVVASVASLLRAKNGLERKRRNSLVRRFSLPTSMEASPTTEAQSLAVVPENLKVGAQDSKPILIFDWDDTLLPTTFLRSDVFPTMSARYGKLPPDSSFAHPLCEHGKLVLNVLRAACEVADVAIVTLGADPWVTDSAVWYLGCPDFGAFLKELNIPIFYARGAIGPREKRVAMVDDSFDVHMVAKRKTMKACLKKLRGKSWKSSNVTSIGDAISEQEAIEDVMWNGDNIVKTLKFLDDPSFELLRMQLEVLLDWLPVLSSHRKDACIKMESNPNKTDMIKMTFVPFHQ